MSSLRGSKNYVWSTNNVLGKGATGAVYQGNSRETGEAVAVKTFNHISHMRSQDVQMREFEVLQKVNHQNVVKLLAIEEDSDSANGGKVIVMELCTGGSLFNILDDPRNMNGLSGSEVLNVLKDLTAGMRHLRDNNLVHRDLKPGNIMKFIRDDGTVVYKLTDFGAARELHEDQKFISLYGTEEYLHPDLYERAVLRKSVGKLFGASVDLWSIGVTLYHVATGNLPFRPYGGRRNKETMYQITTSKASGVISGVQIAESGEIIWSQELPASCRLSKDVKRLLTPLLSGILEVDETKMWSFDQFFTYVTNISKLKVFYVFNFCTLQTIDFHLSATCTFNEFQYQIETETGIKIDDQLILIAKHSYRKQFDSWMRNECDFKAEMTANEPFLLFSLNNCNRFEKTYLEKDGPEFPNFLQNVHIENDAYQSKLACGVAYVYLRRVEEFAFIADLIYQSIDLLIDYSVRRIERLISKSEMLEKTLTLCEQLYESNNYQYDLIASSQLNNCELKKIHSMFPDAKQTFNNNISPGVQLVNHRLMNESRLENGWKLLVEKELETYLKQIGIVNRVRSYCERVRESWQLLLRNRIAKNLSHTDEQFHVLAKVRISENAKNIKTFFFNNSYQAVSKLADYFFDWFPLIQTAFVQIRILDRDIDQFEGNLSAISKQLQTDFGYLQRSCDLSKIKTQSSYETDYESGDNRRDASVYSSSSSKEQQVPEANNEEVEVIKYENGNDNDDDDDDSEECLDRKINDIIKCANDVLSLVHANSRLINEMLEKCNANNDINEPDVQSCSNTNHKS